VAEGGLGSLLSQRERAGVREKGGSNQTSLIVSQRLERAVRAAGRDVEAVHGESE